MKLVPLANYEKKVKKMTYAKLLKAFNATFQNPKLVKYHEVVNQEMADRVKTIKEAL